MCRRCREGVSTPYTADDRKERRAEYEQETVFYEQQFEEREKSVYSLCQRPTESLSLKEVIEMDTYLENLEENMPYIPAIGGLDIALIDEEQARRAKKLEAAILKVPIALFQEQWEEDSTFNHFRLLNSFFNSKIFGLRYANSRPIPDQARIAVQEIADLLSPQFGIYREYLLSNESWRHRDEWLTYPYGKHPITRLLVLLSKFKEDLKQFKEITENWQLFAGAETIFPLTHARATKVASLLLPVTPEDLKTIDVECSICKELYIGAGGDAELAVKLPCGHIFGSKCITIWLNEKKSNCPLCRRYVLW